MALTPGTGLGPYEIIAQIGVGGMGEVYRAMDTNLKRGVAIRGLEKISFFRSRRMVAMLKRTMIFLLVAVHAASAQSTIPARFREAARVAEEVRTTLGAPGLSMAVVIDDEIVWSAGFGMADVENKVPARGNTVYRIASISKPVGATAVMQLVERGRVKLDDPIAKYVPTFPHPVTLRQIMTHTSGIRHYKPGENPTSVRYTSIADAIRIFKDDPLSFEPGTKTLYSTYAYNLLAGVVESGTGLSFENYLNAEILRPAGMTSTYLEFAERVVPHRARQYEKGRDGRIVNAPYADLSIKWVGGGILSTAEDLARFSMALDSGKLMKPETLRLMQAPGTLNDGTKIEYSLGWELSMDEHGTQYVDKYGSATGGCTYLLRVPEKHLAVAILTNIAGNNIREQARRIAAAIK